MAHVSLTPKTMQATVGYIEHSPCTRYYGAWDGERFYFKREGQNAFERGFICYIPEAGFSDSKYSLSGNRLGDFIEAAHLAISQVVGDDSELHSDFDLVMKVARGIFDLADGRTIETIAEGLFDREEEVLELKHNK